MNTAQGSDSHRRIGEPSDLASQILNSITAKVAVLDQSGTVVAVNDAWCQFAADNGGVPARTGAGASYFDVCRSATGEDSVLAEQAISGIQQVMDGAIEVFKLEYPCHSPAEQRWFLLYVSRLKADKDLVVTTHLSITDRKLTEQRLIEAERLAAIGEAMAGLSHEGRNALQRVQGSLDLLKLYVSDNSEAQHLLANIESGQQYLLKLYEEVKSYAAPITLRHEAYPLDQLVDEAWSELAVGSTSAHLLNTPAGFNLTCEVDVLAIRQVLQHVFKNALSTGANFPEIQVSYIQDNVDGLPAVTVIVSDNGPGVPNEDLEKVFMPFCTTKTRGTGLGLSISQRVVVSHGGRICFGTPRRNGASVYITLPIHGRQQD